MDTKYIIVTGGVLSGLGKGITSASIGHLLSDTYKVVPIKCDGYLNVDPGTMNPIEHGEVYVLDDGTEVDMDFGHYERFLNTICTGRQNLTMGKVFAEIHTLERKGKFQGQTVQLIPHVANHIVSWWQNIAASQNADIVMIEIGGTIGDIENDLYIEAARRLKQTLGSKNVIFSHLTYVPIPNGVNEQKSKPTQQSVSLLMQKGITPDIIIARCSEFLSDHIKNKISSFCSIPNEHVITALDVDNIYSIPKVFYEQGILEIIKEKFKLPNLHFIDKWNDFIDQDSDGKVNIAICGKYTTLEDSYASVVESIYHACLHENIAPNISFINTEHITSQKDATELLKDIDAVIVPGGFGSRGVDGKIKIIEQCRTKNIPYLGICYGLQLAIIEFARNVCNLPNANSTEIDKTTSHPLVDILPDKKDITAIGGTLRKGAYTANLLKDSIVQTTYGQNTASERHRHRYEVNPQYHNVLKEHGLTLSGLSPDGRLVEFIENNSHPYFVATQGHPELKSSLDTPAPLFLGLIKATKHKNNNRPKKIKQEIS